MKFYLSSYKLGDNYKELLKLMPERNNLIGYIPNALDFTSADLERKTKSIENGVKELESLGFKVEILDLKDYFDKGKDLRIKLNNLGGVWIVGGNTFILRQAMRLSGFDEIIKDFNKKGKDFLYAGFSAGVCVLAPSLKALQIVDDPDDKPYDELKETIWEGLGLLDYVILPHYKSNHKESEDIDREIEYCKENRMKFKTLSDGEVIII